MDERRILVSGGAGFLGSHLCDRLVAQGHDVLCVDNYFSGRKRNIAHLVGRSNFEALRHDVTFPLYVEVDEIYNLACPASPVQYQHDPVQTTKTGVLGAINMLGLAKRTGAKILQASTSEVYGDPDQHPQREDYRGNVNMLGPRACYDEAKRVGETLFFDYRRQHDLAIKVVRIFNTYGPRMQADDRARGVELHRPGAPGRADHDLRRGAPDALVLLRGRPHRRDDRRHGDARRRDGPRQHRNPEEYEIGELARLVTEMTGTRAPIEHRPIPHDDPRRRCPDISLMHGLTGWSPKVPLRLGLERTIEYFRGEMTPSASLHLFTGTH